ncbi:uncharacterized protein [Rutidosis leptorrhynchoides]|uniref:uncharacterized protein isoform X1 n=1 Tax=Rutidosis leptorrhynchoides TaxID=125765 RepID=UPI003A994636
MMCDTISPEGFPTHYFCFASFNQLQARSDNRSSILTGTNGKINFLRVSVRRQGETWFVSPREERTSHNEFNLLRSVWVLLNRSLCIFGLVARVTTTSSVPMPIASTCTFSTPFNSSGFMPVTAVKEMLIRAALSNTFGLGGTNVYAWKGG